MLYEGDVKMKRIVIGLLIVIICFLSFIGVPQTISKEYPAIQVDVCNQDNYTHTKVLIKGTLIKKLFRGDEFKGRIEIESIELTKRERTEVVLFPDYIPTGYMGIINADHSSAGQIPQIPSGVAWLQTTKDFSQISFHIIDTSIKVIAPATTLEEAITLYQELSKIH